jgi:DNA repair protein RadC
MVQELTPSNISQRLLKQGAEQLSNIELLAILKETTPLIHQIKTLDLAYQLLEYDIGLSHLLETVDNWRCHTQVFEESNTVLLKTCFEVERRTLTEAFKGFSPVDCPELTYYFLRLNFTGHTAEVLSGLFFNERDNLVTFEDLFSGSIDDINSRQQHTILNSIVRNAKCNSATLVVMARNSLLQEVCPTVFEIEFTRWLIEKLHLTKVFLLDHWIIDKESGISLVKQGFI